VLDDELHFSLWDAVRVLGYRSVAGYGSGYRKIPKELKRRVSWEVFGEEGPRARTLTTAVTRDGLRRLVANSRRAAAVNLAIELNMEVVCVPTPEAEALRIIAAALKPLDFVEEYRVGDYTVDAYLPELNVVVEHDRLNDLSRDKTAEWWRRTLIEDRLGCAYVSFDTRRRDFNPGDVINTILTMDLPERTEQAA
jgi:very-short-patch-repair endonuclease